MAREAQYTEQVNLLVTPEQKARLDRVEQSRSSLSLAQVVREAIDAGLPTVEAKYLEAITA